MLVFKERGNRSIQRKPLVARQRTNNKLNPHMDLNLGHIGRRRVLSPLCYPCSLKTRWYFSQLKSGILLKVLVITGAYISKE